MTNDPLIWALLVPVAPQWLQSEIRSVWDGKYTRLGEDRAPWEVVAGRGRYSALLVRESGREAVDDRPLAVQFSKGLSGPVFLLRLRFEDQAVGRFEDGRMTGALDEPPYAFAEGLGCTLPAPELVETDVIRTVCAIEGATADDVKRALGTLASNPGLHVDSRARGTVVFWSDLGETHVFMLDISDALPAATIYRVLSSPSSDRFGVLIVRGGQFVAQLEIPPVDDPDVPAADSIKGVSTPGGIMDVLGVPAELLGL
jgi:hypothetical protein